MSKGCRSRVKNKKLFDKNYDVIQKKPEEPKGSERKSKPLTLPLVGRGTRYYY
jgi:hypothetical protein